MIALEILERLIAFPTISADSNLALIEWVGNYLDRCGVASRLTYDARGAKANLFASIGTGHGGLILSGHTDVVPVAGQAWTSDPFVATVRDDKIYGRGACDMKGFIAVVLSLVPDLVERGGPAVHLALSYDEEIGCLGVRGLLDDLASLEVRPTGCIIGEPTEMRVIIGHKGAGMYAFEVAGRAAHSSLAPQGVNAIHYATRIIERCRAIGLRLERDERRHDGFDVPYTTIQVNRIAGGTAGNIVADRCSFQLDIRTLPDTDQEELLAEIRDFVARDILPEMRAGAPEASIGITQIGDVPGFAIDDEAPLVRLLQRARGSNSCNGHVAFGTEAGLFQRAGIPTVVCGPGSIEQAHRPDEFVTLDQLVQCERMLRAILIDGTRAAWPASERDSDLLAPGDTAASCRYDT